MNETTETAIDVRAEIQKVSSLVTTARRRIADGKLVDLSALEGRVSALSDVLRGVGADDAEPVRESVSAIMENLDRLEGDLTAQYEAVARELESGVRARAAEAYGKAGAGEDN